MADKRDYYEILGVSKTATESEIKSAFRKKAKECHPDLHPGDKAKEAQFKELNEAEKFADEDKMRKEEVETRNHADQLIYTTERSLKEMGDKIDASGKEQIEKSIADLKKTIEGSDVEMIKTATERLTEVSYSVFGKVYEQAQQQAGGAGFDPNAQGYSDAGSQPKDDVVDADYEVVDDNK